LFGRELGVALERLRHPSGPFDQLGAGIEPTDLGEPVAYECLQPALDQTVGTALAKLIGEDASGFANTLPDRGRWLNGSGRATGARWLDRQARKALSLEFRNMITSG
jgi:hypothetical protein